MKENPAPGIMLNTLQEFHHHNLVRWVLSVYRWGHWDPTRGSGRQQHMEVSRMPTSVSFWLCENKGKRVSQGKFPWRGGAEIQSPTCYPMFIFPIFFCRQACHAIFVIAVVEGDLSHSEWTGKGTLPSVCPFFAYSASSPGCQEQLGLVSWNPSRSIPCTLEDIVSRVLMLAADTSSMSTVVKRSSRLCLMSGGSSYWMEHGTFFCLAYPISFREGKLRVTYISEIMLCTQVCINNKNAI